MDGENGKRKDKEKNWSQQKLRDIPAVKRTRSGIDGTVLIYMVTYLRKCHRVGYITGITRTSPVSTDILIF